MKHILIVISLFFALNQTLLAEANVGFQRSYETSTLTDGTVVYLDPDTFASFPGGTAEMHKFITQNLRWPEEYLKIGGVRVTVYLRATIKENGEIATIIIVQSVDELFDKEAIRIVRLMPDFIPAKARGENVASYFIIPVRFRYKAR